MKILIINYGNFWAVIKDVNLSCEEKALYGNDRMVGIGNEKEILINKIKDFRLNYYRLCEVKRIWFHFHLYKLINSCSCFYSIIAAVWFISPNTSQFVPLKSQGNQMENLIIELKEIFSPLTLLDLSQLELPDDRKNDSEKIQEMFAINFTGEMFEWMWGSKGRNAITGHSKWRNKSTCRKRNVQCFKWAS